MKQKSKKEDERIVIETFHRPPGYIIADVQQETPSLFNSMLRVRKWRVTIEPIDESDEVIRERLIVLWLNSSSHHDTSILLEAAKGMGLDLRSVGEQGSAKGSD